MAVALQYLSSGSVDNTSAPQPTPWVWDGILAGGMVTLLTSRWKAGKTTLVTRLLARFGRGGPFAGGDVTAGSAVVLSEEADTLWKARIRQFGYVPTVRVLARPFRGRPTPAEWVEMIAQLAAERPDLVVIDTLGWFLPGAVENHATAMLDTLEPLHRLTDAGIAVLLIHHPRKGKGELSPRGTGALTAFADILVELDHPREGQGPRCRRMKVESRLRDATARTIELSADGRDYAVVPDLPDREGFEAGWPLLQLMLLEAHERQTRRGLLNSWPQDYEKPSFSTLVRWLDRAVREQLVEVRGTGRNADPFRYSLPGKKFEFDPLSEPLFDLPGGPMSPARLKKELDAMKKTLG